MRRPTWLRAGRPTRGAWVAAFLLGAVIVVGLRLAGNALDARTTPDGLEVLAISVRNHGPRDPGSSVEVRLRNHSARPVRPIVRWRFVRSAQLFHCAYPPERYRYRVSVRPSPTALQPLAPGDMDRFSFAITSAGDPSYVIMVMEATVLDDRRRRIARQQVVVAVEAVPLQQAAVLFGTGESLDDFEINYYEARVLSDLEPETIDCFRRQRRLAAAVLALPGVRSDELRQFASMLNGLPPLAGS